MDRPSIIVAHGTGTTDLAARIIVATRVRDHVDGYATAQRYGPACQRAARRRVHRDRAARLRRHAEALQRNTLRLESAPRIWRVA